MSTKHQGWYSDPADAARFRWWTGLRWTNWLSDSQSAPPPPVEHEATLSERPLPDRTRELSATFIAALVVLALVLATFTALGMRSNAANAQQPVPRTAYGEAVTRTNYHENKRMSFAAAERKLLLREGTVSLPGKPFEVNPPRLLDGDLPGIMSESVIMRYTSDHRILTVISGTIDDGAMTWNDPELAGPHLARAVLDLVGSEHNPTIDSVEVGAPRLFGKREGHPASLTSTMTIKGRQTRAEVTVWLFQVEYDRWLGWIQIDAISAQHEPRPDEAAALAALQASLDGIEFYTPAPR